MFDFGKATVLTMYLLPKINLDLRPRILSQMRPGTRVVSHDFDMGDMETRRLARSAGAQQIVWPAGQPGLSVVRAGQRRRQLAVATAGRRRRASLRSQSGQTFQELSGETLIDGGTATVDSARSCAAT